MDSLHLPPIGKWMLQANGQPADWLGYLYDGKQICEPINMIFIDSISLSNDQAQTALIHALTQAGYPIRTGHSSGYKGEIDTILFPQLPSQSHCAFSNRWFIFTNNHGRIFGPYKKQQTYYFIGAFSKEVLSPFTKIKHIYGSFNQARDDLIKNLNAKSSYVLQTYVNIENTISNNPTKTTGDHDGMAAVVKLQ